MFLDDELIQICINAKVDTPDDVQQAYNVLIRACDRYYKSKVKVGMPKSEVKVILDRTFKLWDSFVRMSLNHTNNQVAILGTLCENHSFKNAFLSNKEISEFYNLL